MGWHRDMQGDRGCVGHRDSPLLQPTLSPSQVKMSLQGTAARETPIAFEELEGTCRTSYGYGNGAGTAQLLPAALALALALLRSLLP